jgi:hypothetical protein
VHVGLTPAQGLFLGMSIFDGYNRRKNKEMDELNWVTNEMTLAV